MIITPGLRVADYATPIDPARVAAAGYAAVVRYINGRVAHWKVLTAAERDAIHAAGLGLMLVWETSADRPLSGAQGGALDGRLARADLLRLGCPADVPVLCAVDIDVTADNLAVVRAYVEAFRDAVMWPCGVYGDFDAIDLVQSWSAVNWQANARWWSRPPTGPLPPTLRVHPAAHMRQYLPDQSIGDHDPNVCLRPVRFWHPTTTDPDPEDHVHALDHPTRIYDSRIAGDVLQPGEVLTVPILANEVDVNIAVVPLGQSGFLTAWGAGQQPGTSNVNYGPTHAVSNQARVKLDGGVLRLAASTPCHVVVDLQAAG